MWLHPYSTPLRHIYFHYQFLEDHMGSDDCTRRVLGGEFDESKRMLKKSILNEDWLNLIKKARNSTSCNFIANIASDQS